MENWDFTWDMAMIHLLNLVKFFAVSNLRFHLPFAESR